jgi:transcriptional regulator with XRE-family HTH domain
VARPKKLRKVIAEILLESELPRTLVAKDAGLGRATLESWLSGLRNPSAESVAQIASGLEQRAARLQQLAARLRKLLSDGG